MNTQEETGTNLLRVRELVKLYPVSSGFLSRFSEAKQYAHAVDGVNLDLRPKEVLALVGESGSGKTTLGRLLMRLIEPTSGSITYGEKSLLSLSGAEKRELRQIIQIIYQDPYDSLDPRSTVYDIVAEPLIVNGLAATKHEEFRRVVEALEEVELTPARDFMGRFPHELSGGQRQRAAIARALALRPKIIIADEPVSMLDVSIRAGIVRIILKMRDETGSSVLFITHDLALARHIADRVAVMYLGKIVEIGPSEQVVRNPLHPYTKALVAAIPSLDPSISIEILAAGEAPSSVKPPAACRFNPRCPLATEVCRLKEPLLLKYREEQFAACHHTGKDPLP